MNKGNLLIIDDEEKLLDAIKELLEQKVDKIFTAVNGIDGLDILKKEKIDCVVCDIKMPKMNGLQVIKAVREMNNDVPFIFYTSHGNQDLMMEAVKYGAFDFVDKVDIFAIEEVVPRALGEGIKKNSGVAENEDDIFMSDYQKLLKSMR